MLNERCYLEHANITVRDIDEAVQFLTAAFPHFKVRGRGESSGRQWVHVGTDDTYVCFNSALGPQVDRTAYDQPGMNHLGFVVEDAEAVVDSLTAAGYKEGYVAEPHPHRRRVYFNDRDGNEWEFVQYFSDNPVERNDYSM